MQPYLTLVSAAHFHSVARFRTDQVKTTFLSALSAFVDALQDYIRFAGFFDGDHLQAEAITASHHAWKRVFTYFALKLSEVVRSDYTADLLLDFAVDPHFQALDMDSFTGTLAFAGRNQEIVGSAVIAQAEFAVSADRLSCFVNSIEFSKEEIFLFAVFARETSDFDHSILYSAQLDYDSGV